MGIEEHLADIDFRRKEVRQAEAVPEFKDKSIPADSYRQYEHIRYIMRGN